MRPSEAMARASVEGAFTPENGAHEFGCTHHALMERPCHPQQVIPVASDQPGVDLERAIVLRAP